MTLEYASRSAPRAPARVPTERILFIALLTFLIWLNRSRLASLLATAWCIHCVARNVGRSYCVALAIGTLGAGMTIVGWMAIDWSTAG